MFTQLVNTVECPEDAALLQELSGFGPALGGRFAHCYASDGSTIAPALVPAGSGGAEFVRPGVDTASLLPWQAYDPPYGALPALEAPRRPQAAQTHAWLGDLGLSAMPLLGAAGGAARASKRVRVAAPNGRAGAATKNGRKHRRLFEEGEAGGLIDGERVTYQVRGSPVISGTVITRQSAERRRIKLPHGGIMCHHCDQPVACSQFEVHAGRGGG